MQNASPCPHSTRRSRKAQSSACHRILGGGTKGRNFRQESSNGNTPVKSDTVLNVFLEHSVIQKTLSLQGDADTASW